MGLASLSSDISIGRVEDITKFFSCGGNLSFVFFMVGDCLVRVINICSIPAFSEDRYPSSFLTNLATGTVKDGVSHVRFATLLITCGSARHFCTAYSTAGWKAKLWNALMIDQQMVVRISDIILASELEFVASHAWPTGRTAALSTRIAILAICLRFVSTNLPNDRSWMGQILNVGRFPT